MKIESKEVTEILRKVGNGELIPTLENPAHNWQDIYAGEVVFNVGDWKIGVFNDCNEFDYIDFAVSPDGRRSGFEDWIENDENGENTIWNQPDDNLFGQDRDCYNRMVIAFETAK